MSYVSMDQSFTERYQDGDFTVSIVAHVKNSQVSIDFSSPEHEARFSFDNFLGLSVAEAILHPALIAEFIENCIGEGEVKCQFERKSDILAAKLRRHTSRGRGSQR